MSATPDSTLANPEQLIADLQRQLAECKAELAGCKAERDEALAREAATAEVLGVINSSPGELAPVFDAMLEKATRICEGAFGVLGTWDGERFHRVAFQGLPPDLVGLLQQPVTPVPGGIVDRLVRGEIINTADLREADYPRGPGAEALLRRGARSCAHVPLRKDDALLGAIVVYRQEVRPFSDKQITLLQNFAAQAVIAIENTRLLTETREALEQQTATAEVLQVINSSPGHLQTVFDAILEKATRLCEAPFGVLRTWDGERFHHIAVQGDPKFTDRVWNYGPWAPAHDSSPAGRIVRGEDIVRFADAASDEAINISPGFSALVEASGMRSGVTVALRKDDTLRGTVTVFRREIRPFTDKQITLLQNFAAQAVIAMENARLLIETREALEQQTATAEILEAINSSPGDLVPVFDAILEKAHSLCGVQFGSLQLFDGEYFRAVATRYPPGAEAFDDRLRQGYRGADVPLTRSLLNGARFTQVPDLAAEADDPFARPAVEFAGLHSLLVLPLRKEDALLGAIVCARQEVRPFSDKEIALLQNFAAQAVIAMENARLLTETREALEQQTATAEVLRVINSSPGDLAPVFDAMLEKATRLCEAPFGNLRTWDGDRFQFGAVYGDPQFSDWVRRRGPVQPNRDGNSPLERIIKGEQVVRFTVRPGDEALWNSAGFMEMVKVSGMRSGILVALRKDDGLLGTISVYRQDVRPFLDEQVSLLQNFAAQAVIAMENARLLGELRQRTDEVAELNRGLEARVAEQVEELGRVGRLKRFLAPQLAELIVSQGDEKILESHRRDIVVVFCDLRGYTAFTETAEPEEVLEFLREYHGALGPLVSQFEGTLDQFSGDGIMVFFNDPVPCPSAPSRWRWRCAKQLTR